MATWQEALLLIVASIGATGIAIIAASGLAYLVSRGPRRREQARLDQLRRDAKEYGAG